MKQHHFSKKKETLCWGCRNCTRCSWADGIPVKGWEATPTIVHDCDGDFKSFIVTKCPLFKADAKQEITTGDIADILGCQRDTVFKILKRKGEAFLKEKLKEKGYILYIGRVPTKKWDLREYCIKKINKDSDKR